MTRRVRTLALAAGLGTLSTVTAAPQTFNTALPVAAGEFVLREQFVYRKATDDPSPAERDLRVLGGISVLGYGVTGDFALFGVLPWLDKELDVTLPGGARVTRDTSGIADARLFGRYTVHQDDMPGRTFRIAPFLGVEDPDSGATSLFLAPGLQYVTKRRIIFGIVQWMVLHDVNDPAREGAFIFRAGFRFNAWD